MRLNSCLTVLHVSTLAALLVTLEADGEDSGCEDEVIARRGTVYEAFLGEELRINCTVKFCSDSPPTVFWYKLEKTDVPVNVSSSSHIRTEWRDSNRYEGISYLIFHNILRSDSGVYQCHSRESVSHNINVSVSANNQFECSSEVVEHTSVTSVTTVMTSTPQRQTLQDVFWPWVYRAFAVKAFVIVVTILCIIPKCGRKGRSKDTPDPSHQPSDADMSVIHIYEND